MVSDGVTCMFTCKACGAKDVPFTVRYRHADEDIIVWMEQTVKPALTQAHRNHSVLCISEHADLKMPVAEGAKGIGMRTLN